MKISADYFRQLVGVFGESESVTAWAMSFHMFVKFCASKSRFFVYARDFPKIGKCNGLHNRKTEL